MKQPEIFPSTGIEWEELEKELKLMKQQDLPWRSGRAYMSSFHASDELHKCIQASYMEFLSENALFSGGKFKSLKRFEDEIIRMTAEILGGDENTDGVVTTGGTESILLAVKAARSYASKEGGQISNPEIVLASSAHPAFDKACELMGITSVRVPLDENYVAAVDAMEHAINKNTIMVVGSAPCWPFGLFDPIAELADMCAFNHVWFHVDACVGGYVAPFVRAIGFEVPEFDFHIEGVYSITSDLHKYGYAAKGISTVLFRTKELKELTRFDFDQWNGGEYSTYTYVGSRSGGPIAAAWVVMKFLGRAGYMDLARQSMQAASELRAGIEAIAGLKIIGDPKVVLIAATSEVVNMLDVAAYMEEVGVYPNTIATPPGIVMLVNPIHAAHVQEFLGALKSAVTKAKDGGREGDSARARYN